MLQPSVTLYFIRHGETDWNRAQRYQGRQDIPLNATGRLQAKRNGQALAEALGHWGASLDFVASPLFRARETMEIVRGEMALAVDDYRTDDRLAEIHYGHWEGQLWGELPRTDPEGYAARQADPWSWQPIGGESYRMLSDRVARWLAEVRRDAVVVSHGGVSRVLRGLVLRLGGSEIARLEVPQDKVLLVTAGAVRWL
ncbi:MAG: histidine phosphatase family protein [Hyphomicrobiaceae bacterium]